MTIREPSLPPGWYPQNAGAITRFLESWKTRKPEPGETGFGTGRNDQGLAALSPHAGWYYSGAIAAAAFASLDSGAETLAILGGHLAAASPVLVATEDAFRTPLGLMEIDGELRDAFCSALSGTGASRSTGWMPDLYQDNTVEVLLPMARFFFPRARLLALRLPAVSSSCETGKILAELAGTLGRKLVVAGSTDLTHYGQNYGFSPRGQGEGALAWVREVNDRRFIEAVLSGDPRAVLDRAEGERSACSAGAALGVLGFVQNYVPGGNRTSAGRPVPKLLAYGTSADLDGGGVPGSFVGYAAIGWK
ncbi:MAG: AmmeMemoRadiSam system protein B [Treponema sp.]|jgi:AmmeMemoRadiSam system protein B|nr:AmmeMemoRadiSam system protein B [Treponema sp.]